MHTVLERSVSQHFSPCAFLLYSGTASRGKGSKRSTLCVHFHCISIISQHFLPCAFLLCSSTVGVHFYCIAALFACFSIIPQHCIPALYACISIIFKHFSGCIYTRLYVFVCICTIYHIPYTIYGMLAYQKRRENEHVHFCILLLIVTK